MDYLFVVRILIALFIGFWLARRFRVHIRSLVVRLLPLKYRMSERSFYIQTKISTTLGFIIALGVGFIVNEALERGLNMLDIPLLSRTEQAAVITPPSQEMQEDEEPQEQSIPDTYSTTIPVQEQEKPEALPAYKPETPDITPIPSANYYLQLSAFDNLSYAEAYYHEMKQRFPKYAHMSRTYDRVCPYKIVLGPFPNRKASVQFKAKYNLNGFPRKIEQRLWVQ